MIKKDNKMNYKSRIMNYRIGNKESLAKSLYLLLAIRYSILIIFICFLVFVLAPTARAGTIIKAPAYLGLNAGLVGYWTFDGSDIYGTSARDKSGNGNHGTITGATKSAGKIGQALSFDGSTNYVSVTDPGTSSLDITGELTLAAWIYKTQDTPTGGEADVVVKGNAGGNIANYWLDMIDVGNTEYALFYFSSGGPQSIRSTSPIALNRWIHVAVTYNDAANSIVFYYDGQAQSGEANLSGSPENASIITNNESLRIGWTYANQQFPGIIDDVRVYNRALSAGEIARLYKIGSGSKFNNASGGDSLDKGLVGHWTFDGTDIYGTSARDRSGNGNHGTITGATKGAGKIGQALSFDGVDDQVVTQSVLGLGISNVTIAHWVYLRNINESGSFVKIGQESPSNNGYALGVGGSNFDTTGNDFIMLYEGVRWIDTSTPIGTGWHHVVMTINSSSVPEGFIDGRSIGQFSGANPTISTGSTKIGGYTGATGENRFGNYIIDDVRIYNRTLSADEIKRLYNQTQSKFNSSTTGTSINKGLVGHWTFDGGDIYGTSARDKSGNGNHGTISGATKIAGKLGQSLSFNGTTDYINMSGFTSNIYFTNTTFTVSAWFKTSAGGQMVTKGFNTTSSFGGWVVSIADGIVTGATKGTGSPNATSRSTAGASYNDGAWHHVAVVFTTDTSSAAANIITIYIDGALEQDTLTQTSAYGGSNSDSLRIGRRRQSGSEQYFGGSIDDVRIYNRALSAEEVKILYNMGR